MKNYTEQLYNSDSLGFYPDTSDTKKSHATEEDVKNAYEELRKSVLSELNAFFELQLKVLYFQLYLILLHQNNIGVTVMVRRCFNTSFK